jgi:NADPH-dependent glutamate synthase beta subunit-like oxidoreductase/NAD(P)H-flavin reductase
MLWKNPLKPAFGLEFADLYDVKGLEKLNLEFVKFLQEKNSKIANELLVLQKNNSEVLIEAAKVLEDFIVELFQIEKENNALKKEHEDLQKIYYVRREFVQRFVAKKYFEPLPFLHLEGREILKSLNIIYKDVDDLERQISAIIFNLLESLKEDELFLQLVSYATWALYSKEGRAFHKDGALFILPQKIDFDNLIKPLELRNREGFNLTDDGYELNRVLGEANYCIFCHKQDKDSCRKGLCEKSGEVKKDSLNIELKGCPLGQKISEMNLLKAEGLSLASLAIAIIDNPMIAGTGHRICNDCMKSCIYQKQDPVDIPQIETRILKDILLLPYGFEIYSLLVRWNPLNVVRPFAKSGNGKKILICGLGPAGYTLSHYLLNEGFEVVAIDGLKIEPLDADISGIDEFGERKEFRPIKFIEEIYEPLASRLIHGFGGVAEYGITARWDKNFLKIIRLLLERRSNFRMFGGLRFGSSITIDEAIKDYGFSHVALCIGAGKPNIIKLENNFAKGIRQASDFLMALQLNGAFREDLQANLQIRMPIVVIGGGLTAIDVACEAGAYYIEQIKKFAKKVMVIGKEKLFSNLSEEEKIIANEFLYHYEELIKSSSNYEFLKKFGGVKILYRKKIQDSPSYRHNHQELNKALEEGVEFIENIIPLKADIDEFGHIKSLQCNNQTFACKSLLIAAGTSPNLTCFSEDGLDINSDHISFFGDASHKFEGNVVKAMASAKLGYKKIIEKLNYAEGLYNERFLEKINYDFLTRIEKINRLSDNVVEVFIKAPLLAKKTEIGHIFRLQNFHALAKRENNKILAMEGVAITALGIDRELGIISGIIVETGGSASLIKNFKPGEPCVFMGPSGKPTQIPKDETVLLIGGGRGNQPLTALAEVFRSNGCKVIFVAGYRNSSFVVRQDKMENCCDKMIFAIEDNINLKLQNQQSLQVKGTVIDAIKNFFSNSNIAIDRIFAIGNDWMMHEIAKLRHENIVPALSAAKIAITSLNAPMQCMLKAVCSQCLQKRKNDNGEDEYFYACIEQDQDMDKFDFEHLHARCAQNSLLEKL